MTTVFSKGKISKSQIKSIILLQTIELKNSLKLFQYEFIEIVFIMSKIVIFKDNSFYRQNTFAVSQNSQKK